jgi:hypothetical protein
MRNVIGALLLACAAFSAACSSGDDDDDNSNGLGAPTGSTECQARSGAYTFTFAERSGDCGPLDPQIVVAGGQSSAPDGCTGGQVPSASDSCLVSLDQTCPAAEGTSVTQVGQVRWAADASSGSGTVQVTLLDAGGTVLCQSTYGLTITR